MFPLPLRLALPLLACGTYTSLAAGQALIRAAAESNVNQRYVIESVTVAGMQLDDLSDAKLTPGLRERLSALVGERCDMTAIEDLAAQLRKELHLKAVTEHLSKGSLPDRIRVNFEIVRRDIGFDISVPKFLYHSKQGWTGEVDASTRVKQNTFTVGVLSNGDDLTERFAGMTGRYDNSHLGSDKVRFGLEVETYHEQWNRATQDAIDDSDLELYRTRNNVQPQITFAVARPLTVSVGASFEQLGLEGPNAGTKAANAVTADVHYGRKFEGSAAEQQIDAKYSLRAGTRGLGSDYSYARHMVSLRYGVKSGRQSVSDEFLAGTISGEAPLFERFVLGSSSTLRGWNRYDIDALGGSRVAHNSVTYGYRFGEGIGEVFYDAGALWHSGQSNRLRHSVGIAYRQGIFFLTLALPVRDGPISPVFMVGMNY